MCIVEVLALVLTLLGVAYWAAGIFLPSEYDVENTVKGKDCGQTEQ